MKCLYLPLLAGSLIFFTSSSNAGLTQEEPSEQAKQLEQTKFAVIKELAESGVEEAFLILARLSERRAVSTPLPDDELVHWYIQAAQHGRSEAILWLGHHFLHGRGHKPDLKNASLRLLASSAVLGNIQATNDLVLIPKIMAIDYADINLAFHDAIIQLKSGSPIECSWLKCGTKLPPKAIRAIENANIKSLAFEAGRQDSSVASYYQYIKLIGQQQIIATIQDTSLLQEKIRMQNSGKIKKLERIAKEQGEQAKPGWALRTYLDRVAFRRQGAKDTLEHYRTQDLLVLEDDLRRTLKLINSHRDPSAQISYEEMLENTGMKP